MNREDIISMYEKANGWSPEGWDKTVKELERFAELVAAAEREECAKIAEEPWQGHFREVAAQIRARLAQLEPQREWVGLTDDDFLGLTTQQIFAMKFAEAKLKEKNT